MLAASPILVFYGVLLRWATTIPLVDDYMALLRFALVWRSLPTLSQRLSLQAAAQDGDYKLLLDHAVVALDLSVTGRLHLGFYLLLGNSFLLLILWLLWKHTIPQERVLWRRVLLFSPVCFLLFQLNYADTLNWSMGGMQNLSVIAFACLAIHLLLQAKRASVMLSSVAMMLACCGSANGFLLFPIGGYLLVRRRAWAMVVCWCGAFLLALGAYLYRFQVLPKKQIGSLGLLHFALSFAGGGVESMSGKPVAGASVVLGALLLLFFAFAFWRRADCSAPYISLMCVWVLLTAALVTVGRAGFGINIALSGRYKIYSDLLLIFAYLFAISLWRRDAPLRGNTRVAFAVALFASVAMCISSDLVGGRLLEQRRERLQQGIALYLRSGETVPPMQETAAPPHTGYTEIEIATRDILKAALAQGIYYLPPQ